MKSHSLIVFLFPFLCLLINARWAHADKVEKTESENIENDDVSDYGGAVEVNPDYVDPDSDSDTEESFSDLSEEADEEEFDDDELAVKASIQSALEKSKLTYKKSMKKIVKNRTKITLALAVFAFRREIGQALSHFMKSGVFDPKTGKVRLSPTKILKLILFIDFMRRIQNSNGDMTNSNSMDTLSMLGQSSPALGRFLSALGISSSNPAYLPPVYQHYTFERVNERYLKDGLALHKAIHSKHEDFKWPSSGEGSGTTRQAISNHKFSQNSNETIIILDFSKLGAVPSEQIRDQVSFVLSQYRRAAMTTNNLSSTNQTSTDLEVVVVLESPGGSAVDFGLAAQQLLRLRNEPGILLTICVDRVAASGGYMLACTASPGQLFAAPFSVVGSIGVLGQIVNINELLESWGVKPMIFRGGKDKAPLGAIGEITKDAKVKTQSMIDDTHKAFKRHVATSRPVLAKNIEQIGTGDVWLGSDALELNLVDRITTSDEYLGEKVLDGARVLKMVKCYKRRFLFGRHPSSHGDDAAAKSGSFVMQRILGNALRGFLSHAHEPSSVLASGAEHSDYDELAKIPIAASVVQTPKARL